MLTEIEQTFTIYCTLPLWACSTDPAKTETHRRACRDFLLWLGIPPVSEGEARDADTDEVVTITYTLLCTEEQAAKCARVLRHAVPHDPPA